MEDLEIEWWRGNYLVGERSFRAGEWIVPDRERLPKAYVSRVRWDGRLAEGAAGLAVALGRLDLGEPPPEFIGEILQRAEDRARKLPEPQRDDVLPSWLTPRHLRATWHPGTFGLSRGALNALAEFYEQWGPLGLAHHRFEAQSYTPCQPGQVWVPAAEAGDGEVANQRDEQWVGRRETLDGICDDLSLERPWEPRVLLSGDDQPFYGQGWEPAADFYSSWLPSWHRRDHFPSITSRHFRNHYGEPIAKVVGAIHEFQLTWREAGELTVFRGTPERRDEWLRSRLAPHLRRIRVRMEIGPDGKARRRHWAPSLLAVAYYELAALVSRQSLRRCEVCGEWFAGWQSKNRQRACPPPKPCAGTLRQRERRLRLDGAKGKK